jgi:hypothetical protein
MKNQANLRIVKNAQDKLSQRINTIIDYCYGIKNKKHISANRARHLVRVLYKNQQKSSDVSINFDFFKQNSNPILRGIGTTLEYLVEKNTTKIDNLQNYALWGLYEKIELTKPHASKNGLHFAIIGGNTEVRGDYGGFGATFKDNSLAIGFWSGRNATFYDKTQALGESSGEFATFKDFSIADGENSGEFARFHDSSKATGHYAGRHGKFYEKAQASGKNAGIRGSFHNSLPD